MTFHDRTKLALLLGGCLLVLGCSSDRNTASPPDARPPDARAAAGGDPAVAANPEAVVAAAATAANAEKAAAKDVTFDDIKLELKKGEPFDPSCLTPKVKGLDGKAIRIRGFILPSFQQSGIRQFVLVRDNQECCFGPGALLHDCVLVEMIPPATTEYSTRAVSVEGAFSIRELKGPDGKHLAIYHLDGIEVK